MLNVPKFGPWDWNTACACATPEVASSAHSTATNRPPVRVQRVMVSLTCRGGVRGVGHRATQLSDCGRVEMTAATVPDSVTPLTENSLQRCNRCELTIADPYVRCVCRIAQARNPF